MPFLIFFLMISWPVLEVASIIQVSRWVGPLATFLLMGAFFLLFGFNSINLYELLKANISLIVAYGMMAIADGALRQLVGILGAMLLTVLFFALFAVCERVLVNRLVGNPHDDGGDPRH